MQATVAEVVDLKASWIDSLQRLSGTVAEVDTSELICCAVHGSGQLSELIGWLVSWLSVSEW